MLMIALLSSLCGGQTCVDMADFAVLNERFLRRFMRLEHGLPSHDAFSRLFRMMDPFAAALSRFASGWAKVLEAEGISSVPLERFSLRLTQFSLGLLQCPLGFNRMRDGCRGSN